MWAVFRISIVGEGRDGFWEEKMKRFPRIFGWSLAILLLAGFVMSLPVREDAAIYDKVIRLHVLANSDSESDQALKLTVRDALLGEVAALTEDCTDREEAAALLAAHTDGLRQTAEEALRAQGCPLAVSVVIDEEHYPTREYEGVRLPAGRYTSLRVMIGEAEGQNWWCVLFPPLCVGQASAAEEKMLAVGFTPGQVGVLTEKEKPGYVLRFKLLEILGSLFS